MNEVQRPNRLWPMLWAVVALGALLGSVWASRGQMVFSTEAFIPLNRVASMAALLGIAAMGDRLALSNRAYAVVGSSAFGVHGVAVGMAFAIHDPMTLIALGVASTCFEGVAIAALEMVVLRYALSLGARVGAVVVAVAFLVGQVWDCVFMDGTAFVATVQWLAGSAVAFGALWALVRADANIGDVKSPTESVASGVPLCHGAQWAFLLFVGVVLLQYGFTQSFTGFGGIGSLAHYGLAAGVVMVVVRTGVVCLCGLRIDWHLEQVVSLVMVLWVAALGCTLCTWGSDFRVVADWARTAVYYGLQVLPLAVVLGWAARCPEASSSLLAIGMAVATANQVARFVGWAVGLDNLSRTFTGVVTLLVAGIVITVVAAAAVYGVLFARQRRQGENPRPQTFDAVPSEDATVEQAVEFARRFDRVCDLHSVPRGEREVLFLAVHGYTIDNIAAKLPISRETVKTNLSRAYTRMGINGKQAFLGLMEDAF